MAFYLWRRRKRSKDRLSLSSGEPDDSPATSEKRLQLWIKRRMRTGKTSAPSVSGGLPSLGKRR